MRQGKEPERNNKSPRETAYAYLASRMRTSHEVRCHLESKGYSDDEISDTINELIGLRYIDDYLYALRYYEYNRGKKRGSLRAERELLEKGIDRETAKNAREDFIYENDVDEFSDALSIALKEAHPADSGGTQFDEKKAAKIARRLESKGFAKSDIFRVLDSLKKYDSEVM